MRCLTVAVAAAAALLLLLLLAPTSTTEARSLQAVAHDISMASQAEDGVEGLKLSWCTPCKDLFKLAQKVLSGEITEDIFELGAKGYCLLHKGGFGYSCKGEWQCENLCLIVKSWAPTVFEVLKDVKDADGVCEQLGYCPAETAAQEEEATTAEVNVEAEAELERLVSEAEPQTFSTRQTTGFRLGHLSDVHTNLEYKEGTWTECGLPSCCRPDPYSGRDKMTQNTTAGLYGDYNCDGPVSLLESLARDIAAQNAASPMKGLVITGDIVDHKVWDQSRAGNTQSVITQSDILAKGLPPVATLPVFPALGNHEGFPVSTFDTLSVQHDQANAYRPIAENWQRLGWMNATHVEQFVSMGGAYVADVPGAPLRVLAINSNFYVNGNLFNYVPRAQAEADPGNQFAFIKTALAAAARDNVGIVFLFHHPISGWFAHHHDTFTDILTAHADNVVALMNGHTHNDNMHVVWRSDEKAPLTMQYEAGSLTPNQGHNPGWRYYSHAHADGSAGVNAVPAIADYTSRRADLAREGWIHRTTPGELAWVDAYTASTAYGMKDLTPASWIDVGRRLYTDDALYAAWYANHVTGMLNEPAPQGASRRKLACDVIASVKRSKGHCPQH